MRTNLTSILPTTFCLLNCFSTSLSSRQSEVMTCDCHGNENTLYKAKFLISEPDSCWVPTLWWLWSGQHTYTVLVVLYTMSWGPAYERHTSKSDWRAVTVLASNTVSSAGLTQYCATRSNSVWYYCATRSNSVWHYCATRSNSVWHYCATRSNSVWYLWCIPRWGLLKPGNRCFIYLSSWAHHIHQTGNK